MDSSGLLQFSAMVICVLLFRLFGHFSEAKCDFEAIFNFGDSNSETGGFWAAFPPQSSPFGMTYFKRPAGRASDGRAAIDFLAEALGLPFLSPYLQSIGSNFKHGVNFATAASTVLFPKTSLFVTGISPFSLGIQLNQMKEFKARVLELHSKGSVGCLPSPHVFGRSLYTIDIGQNDFTSNLATIGVAGVKQYLPEVVHEIGETVKELHAEGGRVFLVFNLAPIGCFPAFLTELPHNSSDLDEFGCMTSYNNAVSDYNSMLKEKIHQIQELLPDDAHVIYVDTHSIKLELFRHPTQHGFLYGSRACCGNGGGPYNFNPQVFCGNSKVINGSKVTATACPDPHNYVSWDGIHATEEANKLITLAILNGSYFHPLFPISKFCHLHPLS